MKKLPDIMGVYVNKCTPHEMCFVIEITFDTHSQEFFF